ncbi:hypothetical protein B0O80DRAFT_447678 [Mortierella sp. GBAus27b]|nr:hypothetical protein BGX31_000189 [Mortierella sp. GBA43]KAI8356537.1 hypothetical protein B0O80DRAFT_447678 [Mortierella sp. GBAus27b]
MSFLRSRPPVQPNRNQQRSGLRPGAASNVPSIKRQIPTKKPTPQPQPGTYTDYKLVSTSTDTLHHIMRFHGNKEIDPTKFTQPVKLHRKKSDINFSKGYVNYKYNNQGFNKDSPTTVDKKDGGPAAASGSGAPAGSATGADTTLIAPYGGGVRNKQMLFKKRTRQIYIANEEERKKKEIEAAPWVIEDDDAQNTWTGQLEGGQHANYVLFVFSTDGFKVVPADKWYKFTPKIQYATLTAEEAEEQYQKAQKQNNSGIRWLMRSKIKTKAEDGEEGGEEGAEGDHMVTVDHEDELGYDEDEAKERKKKRGKHGDADEMDFDEVWQDDEEMPAEMPGFDDDAKDDPRRKQGPAMDSDEEEDDDDDKGTLTETGKAVKKALAKLQKNKVYASDEEKNPYASDQDSSDSDLDEIDREKDKKEDEPLSLSQEASKPKPKGKANAKSAPLIPKKANAVKPAATKPVNAKAVKAKVPMPPAPRNASVGVQPVKGSPASTASSSKPGLVPPSSAPRALSPQAAVVGRSSSPGEQDRKRKKGADPADIAEDNQNRKHSRIEASSSSGVGGASDSASGGDESLLVTEAEVISLLKSKPKVTTRDLIIDLKKKLRKEPRNKNILAAIVKKVATPQDGILVLKEGL